MAPGWRGLELDATAVSGICGSVSIACWLVVFSPQIAENFRRQSADGLSVAFLLIWLAGDVFNVLGAVLQGVLPTMTILAVYYTFADVVLLLQCFHYRNAASRRGDGAADPAKPAEEAHRPLERAVGERQPLLRTGSAGSPAAAERRPLPAFDGTHLSPANPFFPPPNPATVSPPGPPRSRSRSQSQPRSVSGSLGQRDSRSRSDKALAARFQTVMYNVSAVLLVCAAGVFGWWLSVRGGTRHGHAVDGNGIGRASSNRAAGAAGSSYRSGAHGSEDGWKADQTLQYNLLGQIFGYICAALYLGSRFPQLLLNYRRRSTEGISLLFFLFACIGNLTYVLSIFVYSPTCGRSAHCRPGEAGDIYVRYILVNLSWLLGSLGTLLLDLAVFVQFFIYSND